MHLTITLNLFTFMQNYQVALLPDFLVGWGGVGKVDILEVSEAWEWLRGAWEGFSP